MKKRDKALEDSILRGNSTEAYPVSFLQQYMYGNFINTISVTRSDTSDGTEPGNLSKAMLY